MSSNHSLNWTTSYGFESPTATGVTTTKTWRTGLILTYNLTSRLSSTTGVYYHHDENQGGFIRTLDRDAGFFRSFCSASAIRSISVFALHVNYNHTSLSSLGSTPGYSRNRYSAGLSYTY